MKVHYVKEGRNLFVWTHNNRCIKSFSQESLENEDFIFQTNKKKVDCKHCLNFIKKVEKDEIIVQKAIKVIGDIND